MRGKRLSRWRLNMFQHRTGRIRQYLSSCTSLSRIARMARHPAPSTQDCMCSLSAACWPRRAQNSRVGTGYSSLQPLRCCRIRAHKRCMDWTHSRAYRGRGRTRCTLRHRLPSTRHRTRSADAESFSAGKRSGRDKQSSLALPQTPLERTEQIPHCSRN